ncbi:MAG TPA: hypothetical protein VF533_17240 [Solirubrobacteraceae bacterium]
MLIRAAVLPGLRRAVAPAGVPAAARAQTHPPDAVESVASFAEAAAAPCDWLWLLEDDAVPAPDALAELLAAAERLGDDPAPVLLTGLVTGSEPWPRWGDKAVEVRAAERGLVAVRAARAGSLLLRRDALARQGLLGARLRAAGDDLALTGRLLAREAGYLVPRSTARRTAPAAAPSELGARLKMLAAPSWTPPERLWIAFDTVRHTRENAA